jgi:hypothetical protein
MYYGGRNRNAIGRADETLSDPTQSVAMHALCILVVNIYHGDKYELSTRNKYDVMLTVQIRGPGHGSSQWQLVGVGESPPEWGERLLLNTGVIGQLVSNIETVHAMARQNLGPPTIASAGVLSSIDENL